MITLSVVIICYNQQDYISQAIESVLNQTTRECIHEIIVVDDGSVDDSLNVIKEVLARNNIPCHLVHQENAGAAAARNKGILCATGTYIAFLDGDDLWEPGKLESQLKYVAQYPGVGLFFSDFIEFDEQCDVEYPISVRNYHGDMTNALQKLFVEGGPILPTTAVVRRDVFDVVGDFDTTMKYNEDPEMWLRIAAEYPLQKVPGVAARKRVVTGSLGSFIEGNAEYFKIITERMIESHPELEFLRRQREQRMVNFLTSAFLHNRQRGAAIHLLFSALCNRTIGKKGLVYFVACLTPVPSRKIIEIARWMGNKMKNRSAEKSIWV